MLNVLTAKICILAHPITLSLMWNHLVRSTRLGRLDGASDGIVDRVENAGPSTTQAITSH